MRRRNRQFLLAIPWKAAAAASALQERGWSVEDKPVANWRLSMPGRRKRRSTQSRSPLNAEAISNDTLASSVSG